MKLVEKICAVLDDYYKFETATINKKEEILAEFRNEYDIQLFKLGHNDIKLEYKIEMCKQKHIIIEPINIKTMLVFSELYNEARMCSDTVLVFYSSIGTFVIVENGAIHLIHKNSY